MNTTIVKQNFDKERIILHRLLLSSNMIENVGLLWGKTGVMFFFMHYYRHTGNTLYEDIALKLLDEVEENLHEGMPVTFECGLSGIGWAVNYLIANAFVEGDSLEVCKEIDSKIMETDPRRLTNYTLERGLGGIILYVLAHCKVVFSQHEQLPFDGCYLHDLYTACINIRFSREVSSEVTRLLDDYLLFYTDRILPDKDIWNISSIVQGIPDFDNRKLYEYPLGIKQGLSGELFEICCLQNTLEP